MPRCLPRFSSIIICSLALLAACDSAGPKFKSTDITGVEYGRTLELTDQATKDMVKLQLEAFEKFVRKQTGK